jgi:hypothetical protein
VEGWNRRISTCSSCERQKQFASGAGGFVVLVWDSSMVVMITVVAMMTMITMITTAVFACTMSLVGVMSMIRVARAGNAVMPDA